MNKLEKLEKSDGTINEGLKKSQKFQYSKRKMNLICDGLLHDQYDPSRTIDSIESYIKNNKKLNRILYSEISSYIYSLDSNKIDAILINADALLEYALDESPERKISVDCRKIVIKIYDHIQLAVNQIKNTQQVFAMAAEGGKEELRKEIKGIEKEYISILGIFASVVLAFIGGVTFSSAVLQNINNTSIYRLLLVIVFLALILVNIIWLLIKFIVEINDKDIKVFNIKMFNEICIIASIIVLLAWMGDVFSLAKWIRGIFPWCK